MNKTVKLDWPFWKKFLLRVFLITRTPPAISWRPKLEQAAKILISASVIFYFFIIWRIFFVGESPEQYFSSFDLSKPPVVFDGYYLYLNESHGRRSYTEKYLADEKKEPQYKVYDDFFINDLYMQKYPRSIYPKGLYEKRRIFYGYTHKKFPKLIILVSEKISDSTAGDWNNKELLYTYKIINRLSLSQTRSGYIKIYFTEGTKFTRALFFVFFLNFLVSLFLVSYDEFFIEK